MLRSLRGVRSSAASWQACGLRCRQVGTQPVQVRVVQVLPCETFSRWRAYVVDAQTVTSPSSMNESRRQRIPGHVPVTNLHTTLMQLSYRCTLRPQHHPKPDQTVIHVDARIRPRTLGRATWTRASPEPVDGRYVTRIARGEWSE